MLKKYFLKYTIALFFLFFLQSCVTPRATFQSKIYQPQKKAVISYSLMSSLFQPDAVQKRKMDARMKMEEFCGSQKVVIISEEKSEKTTGYYTSTSYHDHSSQHSKRHHRASRSHFGSSSGSSSSISQPIVNIYNIITFECR